jgi:hypothetical protein
MTNRFNGLKVGDRVMHTFSFVQSMSSHGDYSKRRGTIVELPPEGHNLIKVAWDNASPAAFPFISAHNIMAAKKSRARGRI